MITNKEDMKALLWSVSDSYEDFVSGMMDFFWESESARSEMESFVRNHPDAHTDEVIAYMNRFLPLHHKVDSMADPAVVA